MSQDVEARVQTVIAEIFDLAPAEVGPDTSTDTVEVWDSLLHLSLVLALEEEFSIHFDEEETVSLVSYPLITTIVAERLQNGDRP